MNKTRRRKRRKQLRNARRFRREQDTVHAFYDLLSRRMTASAQLPEALFLDRLRYPMPGSLEEVAGRAVIGFDPAVSGSDHTVMAFLQPDGTLRMVEPARLVTNGQNAACFKVQG